MKEISNCCQSDMIEPMTEEEMEDENMAPSMWAACVCYICRECGKVCEPIKE